MAQNDKYIWRLIEADQQLNAGQYGAAIRTATLGVEVLLEDLLDELCKDLKSMNSEDRERARTLRRSWHDLKEQSKGKLTLGRLINLYEEKNIIGQLTLICGYEFAPHTLKLLRSTKAIRDSATHEAKEQSRADAEIIRNRYKQLLRDTYKIASDREEGQAQVEVGDAAQNDQAPIQSLAADWRNKWEHLINEWLAQTDNLSDKVLVGSLMDFLMLVNGLVSDSRVPAEYHPQLVLAINYVILSANVIHEDENKLHALRDDAAVLTFTLQWLIRDADISSEVLNDHWVQEGDPVEAINYMGQHIRNSHHKMFTDDEWPVLESVVEQGPEALWNNRQVDNKPAQQDMSNVYTLIHECKDTTEWEKQWRPQINDWVRKHSNTTVADVVMLAPDLFTFATNAIQDSQISYKAKPRLLAAVTYVITPLDLIPEALLGVVGLIDDVGALVLIGLWLSRTIQVEQQILRAHWPRESDPVDVMENLHRRLSHVETIFGQQSGVWNQLRQRFGDEIDAPSFVERVRRLLRILPS